MINFSSVSVPRGKVDLRDTQWFVNYLNLFDRQDEFLARIKDEENLFRDLLSQNNDNLNLLKPSEKEFQCFRHYRAFEKLGAALQLIKLELSRQAYTKVILFAKHADFMKLTCRHLGKFSAKTLFLKSNPIKAEKQLINFNNPRHSVRVYITTIKAAAAHPFVNFTSTNFAFFLEEELDSKENLLAISKIKGFDKLYIRNFYLEDDELDKKVSEISRSAILTIPQPKENYEIQISP